MNTVDFRNIVEEIKDKERIGLGTLAANLNIDRSYLSRVINAEDEKTVSENLVIKIVRKFPTHVQQAFSISGRKMSPEDVKIVTNYAIGHNKVASTKIYEDLIGLKRKDDQQPEFGVNDSDTGYISSTRLDQSDRDLLSEISINQKATLQYLREIRDRLDHLEGRKTGTEAVNEMKELIKKDKASAEKGKQSNRDT
jgi:hypothetical protein